MIRFHHKSSTRLTSLLFLNTLNKNNNHLSRLGSTPIAFFSLERGSVSLLSSTSAVSLTSSPSGWLFPSVRILLTQYGIPITNIKGTGPKERVTKGDVLAYIQSKSLTPTPQPSSSTTSSSASTTSTPPKASTKSTAKSTSSFVDTPTTQTVRSSFSKTTIPHSYATAKIKIDSILSQSQLLQQSAPKISLTEFFIKAAALTLRETPSLNVQWDTNNQQTTTLSTVDVYFTNNNALINKADQQGMEKISSIVQSSSQQLGQPLNNKSAAIAVSNLGEYGIKSIYATITPPQILVLSISESQYEINVLGDLQTSINSSDSSSDSSSSSSSSSGSNISENSSNIESNGTGDANENLGNNSNFFTLQKYVTVNLSYDERVVSGEQACDWLHKLQYYVENPMLLI